MSPLDLNPTRSCSQKSPVRRIESRQSGARSPIQDTRVAGQQRSPSQDTESRQSGADVPVKSHLSGATSCQSIASSQSGHSKPSVRRKDPIQGITGQWKSQPGAEVPVRAPPPELPVRSGHQRRSLSPSTKS